MHSLLSAGKQMVHVCDLVADERQWVFIRNRIRAKTVTSVLLFYEQQRKAKQQLAHLHSHYFSLFGAKSVRSTLDSFS